MPVILLCASIWGCSADQEELKKQELALYNDVVDQVGWQCEEACSQRDGSITIVWSKQRADSVKTMMRSNADQRLLHYQPKLGGALSVAQLSDWLTIDISSWERFSSTFQGTTAKKTLPMLTTSSALEADQLHIDYMKIVRIDTALQAPLDSSIALMRFSKPYYSEGRTRAVVYFESGCGAKAIKGELLMIRQKEKKWVIEERRKVWKR
jgi:hypothetical protein